MRNATRTCRFPAYAVVCAVLLAVCAFATPQTVHLLALRVEFPKEEPDDFTTGGNGLFDMRTPEEALAAEDETGFRYPYDLPPHDGRFLEDHLRALAHYVEAASRGQMRLTWETFPTDPARAYTAPKMLAWYGSGASDEERLRRWVTFLKDALEISTDEVGDLSRFQSVLVFNASVSLQDVLSTELPPLVLTPSEIARSGVSIPPEVTSAWFMPQQIQQPGGVIGLNGAFAKTFLASMGLPVLLNTRTGSPTVGGWTLMDFGSDNLIRRTEGGDTTLVLGFVPCLPMAWEQMRLGWLEPMTVRADTTVHLAALAVRQTDLPRAIKVPITADEYFLLELRRARVKETGRHPQIEYSDDGRGVWLWPENDDYDAYTPGSGVLVFHVDETRIRQWEPTNSINVYPDRPGIFLVEADGWRDIGISNTLGNPRANEGVGSRNDPFPTTGEKMLYAEGVPGPGHPVSLANDGTPTGIEITFAPYGVTGDSATVTIAWRGTSGQPSRRARRIDGLVAEGVAVGRIGGKTAVVCATTDGKVWAFDASLNPIAGDGLVARLPEPVHRKPIVEPEGSILIIGEATAMRYRLEGERWTASPVSAAPPVPTVIRADLDRDGVPYEIAWTDDGTLTAVKPGGPAWALSLGDSLVGPPTVGGYAGDGYGYVYAATPKRLAIFSRTGLEVARAELGRADSTARLTGSPLTTREGVAIVGGVDAMFLFQTRNGRASYAKIFVPARIFGTAALHAEDGTLFAFAGTEDGWLYAVPIPHDRTLTPLWGQLYADGASSNSLDVTRLPAGERPSELMPSARVYCYPSPVGNTEAYLRFYLTAQAKVEVRVYNALGELVWEGAKDVLETHADAENEIAWPGGTRFASGLYLIRVVATADDGRRSAATVPVGIVR